MNKMAKKVRQMLTMLLAASMLAGSIPVNAFAMEGSVPMMEMAAESENILPEDNSDVVLLNEDDEVSENDAKPETEGQNESEEESGSDTEETTEEESGSDTEEMKEDVEETTEEETESDTEETTKEETESEESSEEAVSDNDMEETTEEAESDDAAAAEPVQDAVSGNHTDNLDLTATGEETGEEIVITFSVLGVEDAASLVDIVQIIENEKGEVTEEKKLESSTATSIAGKNFKFKLEPAKGYKVVQVEMGGGIQSAQDGIYTIAPTKAVTVEITLEELEEFQVTFEYNEKQIENFLVYADSEPVTVENKVPASILEESNITFKFDLKDMMKVIKVTAVTADKEEEEIAATAINSGNYTYDWKDVKEDITIKIETSLDDSKCNTLDITIMGHRDSVWVWHGNELYKHSERILTTAKKDSIEISLTDENYKIDKILLNSKEVQLTGNNYLSLDFSELRQQSLVIYTTPKKSEEKKKIIFANSASHVTYEVNIYAPDDEERVIVEKDKLKNNTYTVLENEPYMEFSITHKEGYDPKVEIISPAETPVLYDVKTNGNTDTYSIAVATLGDEEDPTVIKISEYVPIRTISVFYDKGRVENLKAVVDGKYVEGSERYDSVKKLDVLEYVYEHETEIILQTETRDEYILNGIKEIAEKETISEVKPQKKEYTYTIKADKDKEIELQIDGTYAARLFAGSETEPLESEKGIYSVEGGGTYKALLYKGDDKYIIDKAVLKSGSKVLKDKLDYTNFEIPENEAGKTLSLELNYTEGSKALIHKVQLKVLPETKITSITGIKSGKVTQTAGTVKEYKFSSNLEEAEGRFGVEVVTAKEDVGSSSNEAILNQEANNNFAAEIIEDKLCITVKTSMEEKQALVKIYEVSKSTDSEKHYVSGGTILVTSKAPAFVTAKPTVSLKNATNLNLVLSLGMKNLEELGSYISGGEVTIPYGEYWYKIEGIPQDTTKTAEEVLDYTDEFVEYIPCTNATQLESVRVVDREGKLYKEEGSFGYKTDYKIKVSLIQTTKVIDTAKGETIVESGEDKNVAFISKIAEIKASTKVPAYETKLGVKTVKTSLYSGQKDVIVAYPVFSKATTYQNITAEVKWENSITDVPQEEIEEFKKEIEVKIDKDNNILFSAGKMAKAGKYVIELTADVADATVPAKKEFTVQVVQGIYEISLEAPKELYKQYKKSATLKVGIAYNEENEEEKEEKTPPKTKKVEWFLLDSAGEVIDKEHPSYKLFTIKDGVVTIAADFIVSNTGSENEFYVKAVARDFERKENEEEIEEISEKIVITNRKITMGELVLVKENETDSTKYDLIAASGYKAPIDKVNGSKIAMLKKGTVERDWYTESDFMDISGDLDSLLVYSSSSKALEITEVAAAEDESTGNKTIETTDAAGIKLTKIIETKDVASGVKLTVKTTDGSNVKSEISNLTVTYADAGTLGITVKQNDMTILDTFNGGETEFYGPKDETLILKIQEKDNNGDGKAIYGANCELTVTGAKIMESNKLLGEYVIVGTSDTIVVELRNKTTGGKEVFTLKNAALNNQQVKSSKSLSLKVEGTLKTGEFTKDEPQIITYTLPKGSIGKYTHAYVTVDKLDSLNEKKADNYEALIRASQGTIGEIQQLGSDGKVILSFGAVGTEENYYIPEADFTYKLNIAFGTMTENYEFKADVKPNAVTIKTKDEKIVNAKLNTSYNMSMKEGGEVILALNNKKVELTNVDGLMNMNIKGTENIFADLFKVDGNILKLRSQAELEGKGIDLSEAIKNKNNLTGYISEYTYSDGHKEKTIYNTVIKINLKDLVQKYSLSKATVLAEDVKNAVIDTDVNLLAGNQIVGVEYVYVPSDQKFEVMVKEDGSLNFQSKDGVKIGSSNKCVVYVVPEYSYYISALDELWKNADNSEDAQTALENGMKAYGIKLTASIAVKDKAKTTGKIKFASSDLKTKFTAEHFILTDESTLDGKYEITVPYTMAVDWETESVSYESDVIQIAKNGEEDSVKVTVDKRALREAYEAKSKTYNYGKTVSVKATVTFGEGTKDETVTFKVTLPKQPIQLQTAVTTLTNVGWSDLKVEQNGLTAEELVSKNQFRIEEKVEEALSIDGDLIYEIDKESTATVPTEGKEGIITYYINLTDVAKTESEQITAKILLGKRLKTPKELENSLASAIAALPAINNLTSMSEILEFIREYMDIDTYKHLRLYADDVERVEATAESAGYIKGIFNIVNVADKETEVLSKEFNLPIAKLLTFEEAMAAVKEAVERDVKVYYADIAEDGARKNEILKIAREVLEGQNYYAQFKITVRFNYDRDTGKASIVLQIIRKGSTEMETREVTCEFTVLMTNE